MGAFLKKVRTLLERAIEERSSPRQVALSVGVGVFASCTPFIGFHMWIALGLATALRLNRLWAFIGSRLLVWPLLVVVAFSEVDVGHRLRSGAWLAMSFAAFRADIGRRSLPELLAAWAVDWLTGTPVVAPLVAALVGVLAYAIAVRWEGSTGAKPRTPGGGPPPSSGSAP